ncbi:hypothetical protein TNCV_3972511 [Trichonephila clavipes]|nr:hypothetical protein TNCV_3972511 [Trichonephila clavipes]
MHYAYDFRIRGLATAVSAVSMIRGSQATLAPCIYNPTKSGDKPELIERRMGDLLCFLMKPGSFFGANDGRVLIRWRPGERLVPNCLWLRHTGPKPGVTVCGAIFYDSRSTD